MYCIKKPVNEFVKTHLLAISLGFMSQTLKEFLYKLNNELISTVLIRRLMNV